jgi:hypothetical protein
MRLDWVRVYQHPDKINIGCDPPEKPTSQYINTCVVFIFFPFFCGVPHAPLGIPRRTRTRCSRRGWTTITRPYPKTSSSTSANRVLYCAICQLPCCCLSLPLSPSLSVLCAVILRGFVSSCIFAHSKIFEMAGLIIFSYLLRYLLGLFVVGKVCK